MPSKPSADSKPLPLQATLHDLAILRAADVDLSNCIQSASGSNVPRNAPATSGHQAGGVKDEGNTLLAQSYEYVKEGRAVIRLLHRGDVDVQGGRADAIRGTLEDVLVGLDGHNETR